LQAIGQECEKSFPVGLSMQRLLPITKLNLQVINFRRQIVKAFCAQEEVVRGTADSSLNADELMQVGMGFARGEVKVFTAALRVKSKFQCDGFEQRGFSGTILANEKCNGRMKLQPLEMANGGNAKRIFFKTL